MKKVTRVTLFLVFISWALLSQAQDGRNYPSCRDLTTEEINLIEKRIPDLREGMSRDEVREALGRDLLKKVCLYSGRGPSNSYENTYYLRGGCKLSIIHDQIANKFKRAGLYGKRCKD
jgi:hypothetical protein